VTSQSDRANNLPLADRTAYAVHPLPLSDVQALRKHVPSFGTHHVVAVLGNGLTLPPLFFTQGGVRAMFAALKQVQPLARASGSMLCGQP
jgi:Rab-binding domain (RBD)